MNGAVRSKKISKLLISFAALIFAAAFFVAWGGAFFSDRVDGAAGMVLKVPVNVIKIESGYYHTLALTSEGEVYVWGYSSAGQCGMGNTTNVRVPTKVPGLSDIVDISAGPNSSFALTSGGDIYAWGEGGSYRLGNNSTSDVTSPSLISMPTNVTFVDVDAGGWLGIALTDGGEVYTWGYNREGQCGFTSSGNNPVRVPTKVSGLSDITQVSIGGHAGMALKNNGVVYTWGSDASYAQLGDSADNGNFNPPGNYAQLTDIKSIFCSYYHMGAINERGEVYLWGVNAYGRVGNGTSGTVQKIPRHATEVSGAKQITAGTYSTMVVTEDGDLYVCGSNNYYELGFGNNSSVHSLKKVTAVSNITWAASLADSTAVIIDDNVYTAGYNGSYQFGNNTTANTSTGQTHLNGKWNRPPEFN
jgi:alpha-tubulin suppressor-like RCC1 family protein